MRLSFSDFSSHYLRKCYIQNCLNLFKTVFAHIVNSEYEFNSEARRVSYWAMLLVLRENPKLLSFAYCLNAINVRWAIVRKGKNSIDFP